jgi:hypothetical protein
MNGYYYLVNTLKDYLKATNVINSVTIGDIFKVDLNKQTIFPLSHIIVNNAQLAENTTSLNVSILFMDIVDESKAEVTDIWDGNDNEQDVLNTQLALASRLTSALIRGSLFTSLVVLINIMHVKIRRLKIIWNNFLKRNIAEINF